MEAHLPDISISMPSYVPSITKAEPTDSSDGDDAVIRAPKLQGQLDKDYLCPICMQRMKDAFLTSCGHSFCYRCVTTHLNNRKNCPTCGQFLTLEQLFPNFLLNKLLNKVALSQVVNQASPADNLRLALQQGHNVSVKELDSLISLLSEKKRKAEQEESEINMEILLDFLHRSAQQKQEELARLQKDLQFLEEDIATVQTRKVIISKQREESSAKLKFLLEGAKYSLHSGHHGYGGTGEGKEIVRRRVGKGTHPGLGQQGELKVNNESTLKQQEGVLSTLVAVSVAASKKRRVFSQFEDLQECYLNERRKHTSQSQAQPMVESGAEQVESHTSTGLDDFHTILTGFTKYSRLKTVSELRHGDLFHSSNIVSSIEFDRDDELFATAGVSRRIKVFNFDSVVNEQAHVHCPVVEMSTRSKLSCLSWNKYIKSHIASSDYEGIVTVWDANTCQSVMEYEEHEKRAWSVDFSRSEPTRLVSGSDDGKVKVWCTRQESSVASMDMKANICCVKFNPASSYYIAAGSADHNIHYYDIRNTSAPLHVFSGHRKAVSYVKFVSSTELVSASTDSTLRLWNVQDNSLIRTLKGHNNEKNFVGLSVNTDYIACGSETNEVYVYYKAMTKPAAVHRFGSPVNGDDSDEDSNHFISAVCWRSDTATMLAANSQGTVKVLSLAP